MLTDTSEFKLNTSKTAGETPEPEYLEWRPEGSPVAVHMSLGAVDGIAVDVLEGLGGSARRDQEVGGLLLGRVSGAGNVVWIERYQRIPCVHAYGPHFILDEHDTAALEQAATKIFETREMAVVGLYRSHTRPGLQLEESDFHLIRRYFSDASDLILLVKPGKANNLFAQFYRFDPSGGAEPVGDRFPFRGSVVTPDTRLVTPDTARMAVAPDGHESQTPDETERTRQQAGHRPGASPANGEQPKRLVSDFPPPPVEPAPSMFGLSDPTAEPWQQVLDLPEEQRRTALRKWLPLGAALLLVGGLVWFLINQAGTGRSSDPAATAEVTRPLGLYVDPQANGWRVLWNPNATALRNARSIQLFAREGDDQNRIDLSARDLADGRYEYHPATNDVTFRLEVADKSGRVSAESFRLMKAEPSLAAQAPPKAVLPGNSALPARAPQIPPPAAAPARPIPAPAVPQVHIVQAKPTYRAPPVVAAGIRPRIKGTIPIDVRVSIDERGRVASASPITKLHDGLEEYLASRAVQAARQWRFEPARQDGKPVSGTQTIHFVFTK